MVYNIISWFIYMVYFVVWSLWVFKCVYPKPSGLAASRRLGSLRHAQTGGVRGSARVPMTVDKKNPESITEKSRLWYVRQLRGPLKHTVLGRVLQAVVEFRLSELQVRWRTIGVIRFKDDCAVRVVVTWQWIEGYWNFERWHMFRRSSY